MKPSAVLRAERLLESEAATWTRVEARAYGSVSGSFMPSRSRGRTPRAAARRRRARRAGAAHLSGFLASRAGLPAPEGAPSVRELQLRLLEVALPWTRRVLDLPPPGER